MSIQQTIFDAVVRHAGKMPNQCTLTVGGNCAYRNENGTNACFIGGLLTDEEAQVLIDAGMRNRGIRDLLDHYSSLIPERLRHHDLRHLLPRLQNIHDQKDQVEWGAALREVGNHYRLDTNSVAEAFPPA